MSRSTDGEVRVVDQTIVVVGAGIGGLTAAALLAARGCRVTVVEKEAGPGGKIRRVRIGERDIDAGPTVFTMRDVFEEIFDDLGASLSDHVQLRRADILARHAWNDGARLNLFADREASADAIGDFAGAEAARGFRRFSDEAERIYTILDRPFLRAGKTYPPGLMWRIGLWRLNALLAIRPYESLWNVLGEHFRDPRLRQLFARYSTYCGSSPFRTPATLMLIAHVEAMGGWLIEGGLSALAEALEGMARKAGVEFRYGEAVDEIVIESGRAAGVRTARGDHLRADSVIVNADPAAIADGGFGAVARRAVAPISARHRSLSALTWMMKAKAEGPPLARHNVFFSSGYPAEFADLDDGRPPASPSVYVCALDQDGPAPAPASQRFQIIVNAPANGDRHIYSPQEIETCTRHMQARLAACGLSLESTAPPQVATPNDFARLFPSTGGALYGRASHGWAASFLRQSSRTQIPGLYCAGGSTHPGAGVPMAALSARLAVETVMKDRASIARSARTAMPGGMSTRSATTAASASPSSASSAASFHPIT